MIKLLLIAAFIGFISASHLAPRLDGRVIGGQTVTIEQFPYQLSLQHNGAHVCGATLISERFVLTAAHCTDGTYETELTVRAGSSLHASGGVLVRVKKTHQHEGYDPDTMQSDIAVLELVEDIPLSAAAQPAPLTDSPPNEGDEALVSGWGRTTDGNPEELQAVALNVVNHEKCSQSYKNINEITNEMFCAASPLRDACQGDSGGPLVSNGKLIGVISWGYGCAHPSYPGVYTSVSHMRDYIRKYANI